MFAIINTGMDSKTMRDSIQHFKKVREAAGDELPMQNLSAINIRIALADIDNQRSLNMFSMQQQVLDILEREGVIRYPGYPDVREMRITVGFGLFDEVVIELREIGAMVTM